MHGIRVPLLILVLSLRAAFLCPTATRYLHRERLSGIIEAANVASVMDKKAVMGAVLVAWAAALQGHIIWVQRQEAFKEKFGTEIAQSTGKVSN